MEKDGPTTTSDSLDATLNVSGLHRHPLPHRRTTPPPSSQSASVALSPNISHTPKLNITLAISRPDSPPSLIDAATPLGDVFPRQNHLRSLNMKYSASSRTSFCVRSLAMKPSKRSGERRRDRKGAQIAQQEDIGLAAEGGHKSQ